jgi:hypothetical protein
MLFSCLHGGLATSVEQIPETLVRLSSESVRAVPAPSPACRLLHSDRKDNMKLRVKQSFLVSNSALIQIIAKQKKSQKMGINYS